MKYHIGDKVILDGIECQVSYINSHGEACLSPMYDGEIYRGSKLLKGLVFAHLDKSGKDEHGNKATFLNNVRCGAV